MDTDRLLKTLSEGIVNIEFTSLNSADLRTIPCTLSQERLKNHFYMRQNASSDNVLVFKLETRAWEDIRIDTIQKWYPEDLNKECSKKTA